MFGYEIDHAPETLKKIRFDSAEYVEILRAVSVFPALLFLFLSGARISEIEKLRWSDIENQQGSYSGYFTSPIWKTNDGAVATRYVNTNGIAEPLNILKQFQANDPHPEGFVFYRLSASKGDQKPLVLKRAQP